MTLAPRISVVIPTYERRDRAVAAVRRLGEQQGAPTFDVTVVVDGSTDGSAAALRALGLPWLRVVEQPNRGAAEARNAGAAASAGEIVLFLDDDMEAAPDLLARHDRAHRDGADVVLGHLPLHPQSPRTLVAEAVAAWTDGRRDRLAEADAELELHDLLTGQISIGRAAFEEAGGFDADFTHDGTFGGEDLDFGHRLRRAGRRIVFDPDAISHQWYEVSGRQYMRQWEEAGWSDAALLAKHPELVSELPPAWSPQRRARWLARLTLLGRPGRALLACIVAAGARIVDSGRTGRRRAALAFGARDIAYAHGRAVAGRSEVLVLALHAIADLADDPILAAYAIPPDQLDAILDALARRHTFLGLDDVLGGIAGTRRLPRHGVLLTFDDGYADLADVVVPRLRARGISAATFVVTGALGATNAWDTPHGAAELPLLDAGALRDLTPQPFAVGAHSRTHPELPALSDEALARETAGARHDLEAAGLPVPSAFCFPYGAFDDRTVAAVRDAGYRAAFTLEPGAVRPGTDPFRLPRTELLRGDTGVRLRVKLALARRGRRLPGRG